MSIKNFVLNILKILVWPSVMLILGLRIIDLLLAGSYQVFSNFSFLNADVVTAIGTFIMAIIALLALILTYRTGLFDKTPVVRAMGIFTISTKEKTNKLRDEIIDKGSAHTLQLINIGKGMAINVIPSVKEDIRGYLLEAINPHSYVLPPNKGTKELGEILRIHGQRFVANDEYELDFENDRKIAHFYIHFEDFDGKRYLTKVKIEKVDQADGELAGLLKTPGIEVWKVIDNIKEIE